MLLCSNPSSDQLVTHSVGCGHVEVTVGSDMAVFDDGVVQVAIEPSLDSCHVLQLRKVAHGDLLLAITGALRGSHG